MAVDQDGEPVDGAPGPESPVSLTQRMSGWLPGIALVRDYQRSWLSHDLIAGLVLTALLVPQGMAYAELAGLPPVTGLYTTVLALLAYALFGPSRILVLGPDSALGPLIAAALLPLIGAEGDPTRAVALASALALLMGLVCVLAGVAKIGRIAELLSKPVRVGYLNGIALVVVVGQLPKLFGFSTDATGFFDEVRAFVEGVKSDDTVAASLVIGLVSLAVILGFRHWLPKVPGVLVAVVGATLTVVVFDLVAHGVKVVGEVPAGFPTPAIPDVSLSDLKTLAFAAVGMAFVTLADTSALSRSLAAKRGDDVDPNHEIAALGAANIAAGLFQGFPVSASASRTAVAEDTGARTQLTGVVGAAAIVLILVAFNDIVANLPNSTLAAIVIAAALNLFDLVTLRWLWQVRRSEFVLSMAALLGVALVGVLEGIVIAILLSLADFVRRAWRPYDAVLGRLPDKHGYHDVDRHTDATQIPGLVIYRFDAPIFFANADFFEESVKASIANRDDPIRRVIVAAEPITDIDTTGADMLADLLGDLELIGTDLVFAELKGPMKDLLVRYELYARIGHERFHPTLGTAIDVYLEESGIDWKDPGPGPR